MRCLYTTVYRHRTAGVSKILAAVVHLYRRGVILIFGVLKGVGYANGVIKPPPGNFRVISSVNGIF